MFISPDTAWGDSYITRIIDKPGDECLNCEIFRNGKEAQVIVEACKQEYNDHRSHSSLGCLTPPALARISYQRNQEESRAIEENAGTASL
ncbi:integrase core domain-containing protein [Chloroflexota bacterium]